MTDFNYRLCNTDDPEERLEDAAMWKALHDVHGDNIRALGSGLVLSQSQKITVAASAIAEKKVCGQRS